MKPEEKIANWIAQTFPFVEKIFLYGSRARGDHQEKSDIDLAVCLSKNANGGKDFSRLSEAVREKAPSLLEIDLIDYDHINASLKEKIDRDRVILYERKN